MFIPKTSTLDTMHRYAVMRRIQQLSDDVMTIEEGSLYSALDSTREALELSSEPESGFSAVLMGEMRGSGRSESDSEAEHN